MIGVVLVHHLAISWKRKTKVTAVSLLRHLNVILGIRIEREPV